MIWNPDRECMGSGSLRSLQLDVLVRQLENVYKHVPFYRKKFDDAGVKPKDIATLEDLAKIPFTTKDELRQTYPFGLFAVDPSEIVEIHTSSGNWNI